MCTTVAPGAKVSIRPVTRSSNRTPTASRRSHSVIAAFAYLVPCIPGMPRLSGWSPGMSPSPIRVVVTGMSMVSASATTSGAAPEATTPPPA